MHSFQLRFLYCTATMNVKDNINVHNKIKYTNRNTETTGNFTFTAKLLSEMINLHHLFQLTTRLF